jgi:hypothetical protein
MVGIIHIYILHVPTRLITDFFSFDVHHHAKVSPSANHVSATNVVIRYVRIFKRKFILLTGIITFANNVCNNIYGCLFRLIFIYVILILEYCLFFLSHFC